MATDGYKWRTAPLLLAAAHRLINPHFNPKGLRIKLQALVPPVFRSEQNPGVYSSRSSPALSSRLGPPTPNTLTLSIRVQWLQLSQMA